MVPRKTDFVLFKKGEISFFVFLKVEGKLEGVALQMEKLVFVGSGSMAEAMISGILKACIVDKEQIYVTNKQDDARLKYMKETYGIKASYDFNELFEGADVIILAMKPKDMKDALSAIRSNLTEKQLVLSIIAGVMTDTIEAMLQKAIPVIRTMPNTSAQIGHSATAIAKGKYVHDMHLKIAVELLQTIGITKVLEEKDMHTVTAVSGSGPAFIYYFIEAMTKAALKAGMDQQTADALITQTIIGAGKMLEQSGDSPEILRKNITSQGGTTEAGLSALMHHNFENIIIDCIQSAKRRSLELADSYK